MPRAKKDLYEHIPQKMFITPFLEHYRILLCGFVEIKRYFKSKRLYLSIIQVK